jgi:GTPase SAR1 family protein
MTGPVAQDVLPKLRETVDRALDEALSLLAAPGPPGGRAALAGALADLERHRARWDGRMRVAVVGKVSAGKSTLVNALLGDDLAKTAVKETTAVVTWLQQAHERELLIFYKDHLAIPPRRVEPPTVEELAELTAHRAGPGAGFDDAIDYALLRFPSEYLAEFDLIDTPGLSSVRGEDSASTLRHLGPRVDTADALVFVFDRGPHADTDQVLAHFQHGNEAELTEVSPLTAVGVLTQIERHWNPGEDLMTPGGRLRVFDQAQHTVADLMRDSRVRKLFYEVQPIASKIGAAAGTCTDEDLADLVALTGLPGLTAAALAASLADARRWPGDPIFAGVTPDRRKSLYGKFTAPGIMLACHLITEGATTREGLCQQLIDHSGLANLRTLLVAHFGERADLIKLLRLIERVREIEGEHRPLLASRPLASFDRATRAITTLRQTETAFGEIEALRAFYDDRLTFGPAEIKEMRVVFGEDPEAPTIAQRLSLPGASPRQLAAYARARSDHWRSEADLGPYHGDTREACFALSNTYSRISMLLERP